jgi:hypothetical protein
VDDGDDVHLSGVDWTDGDDVDVGGLDRDQGRGRYPQVGSR